MSNVDIRSAILGLLLMGDGLHTSDWGDQTNANLLLIEQAIALNGFVGEVREYYGLSLPNANYQWANGQALARANYPVALSTLTAAFVATGAAGQPTVSVTVNPGTYGSLVGAPVEGPGVPSGTKILSVNAGAGTITLSNNLAAAMSGQTLTAFPYGNGDGATTFNVPNRAEVVAIGQSAMGGGAARGLLATPRALGAQFGEELHTLVTAELAVHAHGLADPGHLHGTTDPGHGHGTSDPGHAHTYSASGGNNSNAINSGSQFTVNVGLYNAATGVSGTGVSVVSSKTGLTVNSAPTGITVNNSGGGAAHNNMQPTIACNYIIRVQ